MDRDTSTEVVTRMHRQTEYWIKDSLVDLLDIYSFDEITVKQIVATAKISRPTFYRHYSTKDDVLEDLVNDIISGYIESTNNNSVLEFDNVLENYFNYFESKKDTMRILIKANLADYFTSAFTKKFIVEIKDTPAPWRKWDNDLQVSIGVQFATGGLINVLIGWIATDCKINSKIMIQELMATIQGLG